MKTIPVDTLQNDPQAMREVTSVLQHGGLVCLPCRGSYRIVADLLDEGAVSALLQAKRRTRKAPSLVFVDDRAMLGTVATDITALAERFADKLWPGPLTILFEPNPELPRKIVRQLSKANGKIGVRVPETPLAREVLRAAGRPLLVSSANKERKQGAGSAAQVRKNFGTRIDIFVDAGDLPPAPSSTVVEIDGDTAVITRPGAISDADLAAV